MEESILKSTKKILGLADDYTAFDLDVITHINAAFSILTQLGIAGGFSIADDAAEWSDYVEASELSVSGEVPLEQLNLIKTYIYLKVRILFDPPGTSFLLEAANNQIKEYEWRLSTFREFALPPFVYSLIPVLDGGE